MIGDALIKRVLPKSLLGRSLMIVVMPLVLLQVVSAFIFYESHWDKVSLSLARGLAGDIAVVIEVMREDPTPEGHARAFQIADHHMQIRARFEEGAILPNTPSEDNGVLEAVVDKAMADFVARPYRLDTRSLARDLRIQVQLTDGVLEVITTRKRLFSSTTYIFVMWMVGTSMILFGLATVFMRNQVKPIRRLALAADELGKGRDAPRLKPEGAQEVRQATTAYLAMRDRIQRQIQQRTEMLAGVSHDLRTSLTRMKLQLALGGGGDVEELSQDVAEMERMLEGYLAFARGEGTEAPQPVELASMLFDVVSRTRRDGNGIDLHCEETLAVPVRPDAFRRCVTNLIENAARHGDHVAVRVGRRGDAVEITIDDDGPGIAEDRREDVFKPFFRVEGSGNVGTGGVGLGLTIARDVARGHGGDVELSDSPLGGLRARVRVPV